MGIFMGELGQKIVSNPRLAQKILRLMRSNASELQKGGKIFISYDNLNDVNISDDDLNSLKVEVSSQNGAKHPKADVK